jgi:hypothetical protein
MLRFHEDQLLTISHHIHKPTLHLDKGCGINPEIRVRPVNFPTLDVRKLMLLISVRDFGL